MVILLVWALLGSQSPADLIVEKCRRDGTFFQAGVQSGDRLLSWERAGGTVGNHEYETARGDFRQGFDIDLVQYEQEPRGLITLTLERKGQHLKMEIPPGDWRVSVRTVLSHENDDLYLKGCAAFEADNVEEAALIWSRLTTVEVREERAAWLYCAIATRLSEANRLDEAELYFSKSLEKARQPLTRLLILKRQGAQYRIYNAFPKAIKCYEKALEILADLEGHTLLKASLLGSLATVKARFGEMDEAKALIEEEVQILKREAPASMSLARSFMRLGLIAWTTGDLVKARELHEKAAEVQRALNPKGIDYSNSLENIALFAADQGQYKVAQTYAGEALAIVEKLRPQSAKHARILYNLGTFANDRGDLSLAENYYQQALTLLEKIGTQPLDRAAILTSLGQIASYRGDYLAAESYGWEALKIKKDVAPNTRDVPVSLISLARISMLRGDIPGAERKFQEAVQLFEKIAPNGLDHANALGFLGKAQLKNERIEEAEQCYLKALTIYQTLSPDSLLLASGLVDLGQLVRIKGDLLNADPYFLQAVAIREKLAPNGLDQAGSFQFLGESALAQGDLTKANSYFTQALAIRETLAPGSHMEAETLFSLAKVMLKMNRGKSSTELMVRGLNSLEEQMERLGGTQELQSGYVAKFQEKYWEVMDIFMQQGRFKEAFHIYERSRAQVLRRMIMEKEQLIQGNTPQDLLREKRISANNYEKIQHQIGQLHPQKDGEQIASLLASLKNLRQERQRIQDRISEASPRLAQIKYSEAYTVSKVQDVLDPGTLLLSYAVAEKRTYLFAVSKPIHDEDPGFHVFSLKAGREELAEVIGLFGKWLRRYGSNGHEKYGQELYTALITPAQKLIDASDRVLISPDGPLRALAFGALNRGTGDYLIAQKPLHVTVSPTLYGDITRDRPEPQPIRLVAVGDPEYPTTSEGNGDNLFLRSALKRGYAFDPLPGAREELLAISEIFGEQSQVYMGGTATEGIAKLVSSKASYLHFACHGILDEQSPLDSALALSIPSEWAPGQENGFLQAWEVMEQLKLDAELVVLSSCDSGLGVSMGGEGFLGLAQAFQFAGARSIAASLWQVSDSSTAQLMARFYQYLKDSHPKDQAMRMAKQDMILGRILPSDTAELEADSYAHPFFWAAFQIIGDWQ